MKKLSNTMTEWIQYEEIAVQCAHTHDKHTIQQ